MAIQKKIQLYVSDSTNAQKTAKYYRIPLPADNLPFDKETNIFKNMIHFYCTISGDSATFGAIGFNEPILELYARSASYNLNFTTPTALANYNLITPSIPEKLLNDGELSFDVHGIGDVFGYNSTDGYQHDGERMLFSRPSSDSSGGNLDLYMDKITKKSGIFTSSNVIRSNSENELTQFVPSTWQEFDTMDELLNDVRQRINEFKTMNRGDFATYDEIVNTITDRFNPYLLSSVTSKYNTNNYINIDLSAKKPTDGSQLITGCTGTQQILKLSTLRSNIPLHIMLDTTNLVDEIAVISCDAFGDNVTATKYQPNSGSFKLNENAYHYGRTIVFKNKADSTNIKITFVKDTSSLDNLSNLAANESANTLDIAYAFQMAPDSLLKPSGTSEIRQNTTDIPIEDFYKVNNNENIRYIDAGKPVVTIKSTPGTKYKLFRKTATSEVTEIEVDNASGEFSVNIVTYRYGREGDPLPDLYLVKYEPTDITVSW